MITKRPNVAVRPPVRRSGMRVAEVQRARMLHSAVQVIAEVGYEQMTVARVTGRARVSRRTFYDVFGDREDCFLAIVRDTVEHARSLAHDAYAHAGGDWQSRVHAGLRTLLEFLDGEPATASLLVVDALRAGPRVLRYRARVLRELGDALDVSAPRARSGRDPAVALTGEGLVGAVLSVIHTRLLEDPTAAGALLELLNPLMGMIVLPYRGPAAAQRELQRPQARSGKARRRGTAARTAVPAVLVPVDDPLAGVQMRLTYRTLRVLAAVGEWPGASNRQAGEAADITDQGQISKLLARLERLGLVENHARGHVKGEANAWSLTGAGVCVVRDIGPLEQDGGVTA